MSQLRFPLTTIAIVINLCSIAAAQHIGQPEHARDETPLVTAAATAERVRIAAPSDVVQLRLEVYSEFGNKVFDSEQRGGNVVDWNLQSETGRISDGLYLCVVTVKPLTGAAVQRLGLVAVTAEGATLRRAETTQMSAAQTQAIRGIAESDALSFVEPGETPAATVVAHTGTEGQLARTRGPLSFRLGDVLTGQDREQMRITSDGRVGIGTSAPQATLDVAGEVRARSLKFDDGTVLRSATGAAAKIGPDGEGALLVDGTGTTNRVTKWTNGPAGTLGDSALTEVNGKLGLGTSNPNFELTLFGNDVGVQLVSPATGNARSDGFRFGIDSTNKAFLFNQEPTDMFFGTNSTERMRILSSGNVGIGITNPQAKLDVAGTINTSMDYRIGGNRVLGVSSPANTFAGLSAGMALVNGSENSFFGNDAGAQNTAGTANSFFDYSSCVNNHGLTSSYFGSDAGTNTTTGGANSFFGKNSGLANTTGLNNSIFATSSASSNTSGDDNSCFGHHSGLSNRTGNGNSFFGVNAGNSNSTGSNNTVVGVEADVGIIDLTNATAIGYRAIVTQSNSLVLGSINGSNNATSDTKVGIGTSAPTAKLAVAGAGAFDAAGAARFDLFNTAGSFNYFMHVSDVGAWQLGTGTQTRLFVDSAGDFGLGTTTPDQKLDVAGRIRVTLLGTGGATALCHNSS